ncbi:DUF2069 domain-containing protein [Pseudoxanthomonas indica]|uniref:Predicted membrane protein n=1 Tax=Pseudoxanthomonas indica TaxID=428993 RepID=A0A1T5JN15_9GAMM|nr:DUF2069 domain-containing protein [Pseudoxanthomonas indica]GGD43309.1 membrane protein [Pseudoxanthomonas indica]SKC52791.1 Predicted membrane protein [Pseudoxanthomonas indica]
MIPLPSSRLALSTSLALLTVVFAVWFRADKHLIASQLVFTVPPLLCLIGVLLKRRQAGFWAGVLGLFWFAHGVMVAYSRPAEALFAWLEIVLSLVIVLTASWPGLSARFGRKRA